MGNSKLRSRDFKSIGYLDNHIKSLAVEILSKHFKHNTRDEKLAILQEVMNAPEAYAKDPVWFSLAKKILPPPVTVYSEIELLDIAREYKVYGKKYIDPNAVQQMEAALHLPVAVRGALMPDAHQGYGLPIGGVFATSNAVIPYAVGMDIGCRMSLSVFDANASFLKQYQHQIKVAMKQHTHFGIEGALEVKQDHEVMDREEFSMLPLLKQLQGKAWRQLGSSGSGNHFVEFGFLELGEENPFTLKPGSYLSLLTHSGSRGLGAAIAQHYTQVAMQKCKLPKHLKSMAWMDLSTQEGQEYWMAMNLAGDYAKACHERIHANLAKELGLNLIGRVENHHNFAWKETINGEELIVHRKGATPAAKGQLGIIPGSMASPGYLVSGNGVEASLNSASHGAGRQLSRSRAKESGTMHQLKKQIESQGIVLMGGSVEEAPHAYKDITEVIAAQKELVEIKGVFHPKIVRMNKE